MRITYIVTIAILGFAMEARAQQKPSPNNTRRVDKPAATTLCVPGQQIECACPAHDTGVQICNDDGSRYGTCHCEPREQVAMSSPPSPAWVSAPPPSVYEAPTERRSTGLMVAGIVAMGTGFVAAGVGSMIIVGGLGSEQFCTDYGCNPKDDEAQITAGGAVVGIGGGVLLGGLLMTVLGASKVRRDSLSIVTPILAPTCSGIRLRF